MTRRVNHTMFHVKHAPRTAHRHHAGRHHRMVTIIVKLALVAFLVHAILQHLKLHH